MRKGLWIPILFLAAATAAIAAAALLSERRNAAVETHYRPMAPVRIAVAADLHYLSPALTDGGSYFSQVVTNSDGKFTQHSDAIAEAFASEMLREKPDVLILPGDLTFNGARESHAALIEKLQRISDAGVRVLVLPGNHDLNNPMAARFHGDSFERVESVTAEEFAEMYAPFGYDDALSRDEASLSYVSEITPGLRLLFLDTNTPDDPSAILPSTLRWAEEALKAAQADGARVICVTHQTILQHNSVFVDAFVIRGRETLSHLLQRYGVPCSLCGHMHIQHIKSLGALTEIAGSALSVWPCQYGLLDIRADGGTYRTQTFPVPAASDFAAQAEAFFTNNTLRQGRVATQNDALLQYLSDLNRAYYCGRMNSVSANEALLSAWESADPFIASYLRSLAEDVGQDFTQAEFSFS